MSLIKPYTYFNNAIEMLILYTGYITILRLIHFTYVLETMLYVISGWMCVSYCSSNTHCDRMFVVICLFKYVACMTHRSVKTFLCQLCQ